MCNDLSGCSEGERSRALTQSNKATGSGPEQFVSQSNKATGSLSVSPPCPEQFVSQSTSTAAAATCHHHDLSITGGVGRRSRKGWGHLAAGSAGQADLPLMHSTSLVLQRLTLNPKR